MKYVPAVRAALEEVLLNRTRTVLAMLSVVVGIWSVTTVVAAGELGRLALTHNLEETIGRAATINVSIQRLPAGLGIDELSQRFERRMVDYGVSDQTPVESGSASVDVAENRAGVPLFGVLPSLAGIRRITLVSGRWLEANDASALAPRIVINSIAAQNLGLDPMRAIGSKVRLETLQSVRALIVGVVASASGQNSQAYLPLNVLERWALPVDPHQHSHCLPGLILLMLISS